MAQCFAVNISGFVPGWGCCQCHTFNGNNRSACKFCGHERCCTPAKIQVPVQEEHGVRLVPVNTAADQKTSN